MSQIVFVLGSHRTGTKSVANFLNDNFDTVCSVHQYGLLRFNNILANITIAGWLPERLFSMYLKILWYPILRRQTASLYVESNGFNHYSALFAYRHLTNNKVKILHVVRHPADFVTSYTNWRSSRSKSQLANKLPFWHLNPYHVGYLSKTEFNQLDDIKKNIWRWRVKNEFLEKHYSTLGDNYLRVRFEDIIDPIERANTLKAILDFVGLEYQEHMNTYFDKKQNESKKGYFPEYAVWEVEYKNYLFEVCGELMHRYKYE